MKDLPFFVYGTLLPGQPNFYLWQEAIVHYQPAIFLTGHLYDLGAYPMLIKGGDRPVKGLLVWVDPSHYQRIGQLIDDLEGFDPKNPDESSYRRTKCRILVANHQFVDAWVYLGRPEDVTDGLLINSGNWLDHSLPKMKNIQDWWTRNRFGKIK